jgi:FkbM family methyltransferase
MLIREYGKAKAKLVRAFGLEPPHNTQAQANGEQRFLTLLATFPEISAYNAVIDVGANIGDWTNSAIGQFASRGISHFYCVEPIPTYAHKIEERFAGRNDVSVIERVLSHTAGGTAEIFEVGRGGRLYKNYRGGDVPAPQSSPKKIVSHNVLISTGDEMFGAENVKPNFVKIDCDGHDFHVLRGFKQILQQKRPLVQFEYSDFWIGAGARLRDACAFLRGAGYLTYKMFPDKLVGFKFNPLLETFGYQNVVAVPAEFEKLSAKVIGLPVTPR